MGVLLDSSVLLHCLKTELTTPLGDEEFFLSIMSADELLRAITRAEKESERARRLAWVEAVLENFPVLPIDRATTRTHAQIMTGLDKRKIKLGLHESWIAATCVAHGLTLITLEKEHFQHVPGLQTRTP
jgi:predicted nucleic acid-binding protein